MSRSAGRVENRVPPGPFLPSARTALLLLLLAAAAQLGEMGGAEAWQVEDVRLDAAAGVDVINLSETPGCRSAEGGSRPSLLPKGLRDCDVAGYMPGVSMVKILFKPELK
jgi:hypothetical protein